MPSRRNSGPLDSALLRAPVTGSALREFCFGGKNRFYDQMGSRHGYPVSAFPLRAVQCGVGGLEQFLLGSTMLRKFCDAYGHGDRSERLALVHHRQLAQFGPDSFRAGLSCFQVSDWEDDDEFFAAEAAHNVLGANTLQKERSSLAQHGIARIGP